MIYFIIFLSLVVGLVLWMGYNAPKRSRKVILPAKNAKEKRIQINAELALNWYEKLYLKTEVLLKKIGKDWNYMVKISAVCFVLGIIAGVILFRDPFLSVVAGIAFVPLSYLYLFVRTMDARQQEIDELENTMSIITNAYMASNDILRAFQMYIDEKNRDVEERFRRVTPFDEFVSDVLLVNPNIERALVILSGKVANVHFKNWIKNLILCTKDRNLKFSLLPVLNKMNDQKALQMESNTAMIAGWRNYLLTVAVMFSIIPVLKIANQEWFLILTQTTVGKMLVVAMIIAALVTAAIVVRINKPIT